MPAPLVAGGPCAAPQPCAAPRPTQVQPFLRQDGLLDEFKMMYSFRNRFPLHYFVFKMTASHLPHEANVEQVFSRAKRLADPNTHMTSQHLALFVMVGMNKNNYKPPLKDIKELCYRKFRGNSSED